MSTTLGQSSRPVSAVSVCKADSNLSDGSIAEGVSLPSQTSGLFASKLGSYVGKRNALKRGPAITPLHEEPPSWIVRVYSAVSGGNWGGTVNCAPAK